FFCIGMADEVHCFFCGGFLFDWNQHDDPWTQHAKWYPQCSYVHLKKGDAFVKDVQSGHSVPCDNVSA
ncbi:hypothetical protein CAPTEDRAFT_147035, partial [Capitella teleta]